MKTLKYSVGDPLGIHARPAAQIAQCCVNFKSAVRISCNGLTADGSNVLEILKLKAGQGDELVIEIEGADEDDAAKTIEAVLPGAIERKAPVRVLKIAFFGTKDYDRTFFSKLAKDKGEGTYNADIKYFSSRLTEETAELANGYDAVCIFVNDECGANVVDLIAHGGVKLILLSCAGFNNVDLKKCKEYGIKVLRVPAYSPYAVAEHAMAILQESNRRLHKAHNKVKDNN
ncbi:MAG: HPr family phosphocarrier protein, partial [Holdemanella sp.]|nr:HPr family phosphocarrier protein [Holdemanella sp.]